MKTCLAFRHVHDEDLGLLVDPLKRRGFEIRYVDVPAGNVDCSAIVDAELMIALGGPVSAYQSHWFPWIDIELNAISARLDEDRPILGICLGAQLIAMALGGTVGPARHPEVGWTPIELTSEGLASPLAHLADVPVFQWHSDYFSLPAGSVSLGSTQSCPHQAFLAGNRVLGTQFHLEFDRNQIESWLVGGLHELAALGIDINEFRDAAYTYGNDAAIAAPKVLNDWLDMCTSSTGQIGNISAVDPPNAVTI